MLLISFFLLRTQRSSELYNFMSYLFIITFFVVLNFVYICYSWLFLNLHILISVCGPFNLPEVLCKMKWEDEFINKTQPYLLSLNHHPQSDIEYMVEGRWLSEGGQLEGSSKSPTVKWGSLN